MKIWENLSTFDVSKSFAAHLQTTSSTDRHHPSLATGNSRALPARRRASRRAAWAPRRAGRSARPRPRDSRASAFFEIKIFVHAKRTKFSVWSAQTENPRRVVNDALRLFGIFSLNWFKSQHMSAVSAALAVGLPPVPHVVLSYSIKCFSFWHFC